jgi:hypothetical protein
VGGGKGEGAEAVVGVVVVVVGVVVGVVLVLVVVVVIVVVYYKFKSTTRAPPTRTGRGNFSQRGKVGGHMGGSEQQPLFIISISFSSRSCSPVRKRLKISRIEAYSVRLIPKTWA